MNYHTFPFYASVTAVYEGGVESEYIDSVIIEEELLLIKENNKINVRVYPNPVFDKLYFNEIISEISIIDIKGVLVKRHNEDVLSYFLDELVTGTYFLKGKTKKGKLFEQKFIKK